MAILEIYYSFRSPYSYLAVDRLIEVERNFAVDVDFRPVRPLALREPDFFERARKQFLPYLFKDVMREAERLGLAVAPPDPDPVDMDMANGKVAPDQPIMDRLMRLGVAAAMEGRGLAFAQSAGRAIWGGGAGWHEDAVFTPALNAGGFALAALEAWAGGNAEKIQALIARNEAEQLEHHWGVPLMVFDGEPFFGQDRIDALTWRLDEAGLRRA